VAGAISAPRETFRDQTPSPGWPWKVHRLQRERLSQPPQRGSMPGGTAPLDALSPFLSIVVIDLVLSGDNAIVIGMAAHRLPARQRRLAVLIGGGAAIALRISLTAVAAVLLALPGLQAIGGVLLLWIAFKLLREDKQGADGIRQPASLRGAVVTILLADVIMSLDNILGVAAASSGNLPLLLFGLALSVAILMFGGSLVAEFLSRVRWLAHVGAGVVAWTGAAMLLEDPFVARVAVLPEEAHLVITALVMVGVVALAHLVHRHRPTRVS
jgi:YjbE family integral membrane protein